MTKALRHAVCIKCGKDWNISLKQKIPKGGYICPRCRGKEAKDNGGKVR